MSHRDEFLFSKSDNIANNHSATTLQIGEALSWEQDHAQSSGDPLRERYDSVYLFLPLSDRRGLGFVCGDCECDCAEQAK